MMSATAGFTEVQILTMLRTFLLSVLPTGVEVIRAEINRVAEPRGGDFVIMTPLSRERLSTNVSTYTDDPYVGGSQIHTQSIIYTVQVDIHGPNSAESAQIIGTLWRDQYAVHSFLGPHQLRDSDGNPVVDSSGNPVWSSPGPDVCPLYASEPRQTPFINAEQQYEFRWSIDLSMQANIPVTTPQEFAETLIVTPEAVEVVYPN